MRLESPPASAHEPEGIGYVERFFCIFMEQVLQAPNFATPHKLAVLLGEFHKRAVDDRRMETLNSQSGLRACGRLLARWPGAWR